MAAPNGPEPAAPRATAKLQGPPVEGERERLNRNFAELIQEIRVAEAGVQILFAFLLTLPFTNRFAQMAGRDICAYAVATVGAVVATITLVTPVSYHRLLFRKGRKPELVHITSVLAVVGLAFFGIAFLIADVVLGLGWGIGFAAMLLCLEVALWYILPLAHHPSRRTP
jgi:hypothetical protein